MADITVTSANVRALSENGAIVRPFTAGAALTVGFAVHIASDGDVEHADADAGDPAQQAIGIVVEGGGNSAGESTIAAGDPASVCVLGPVSGFSGMTPGEIMWVSDTVGRIADAPATFDRIIGRAHTAGILWVNPEQSEAASE